MVMSAMVSSAQAFACSLLSPATIGDGRPDTEATSSVALGPTDCLRTVARHPAITRHSPLSARGAVAVFHLCFQMLAAPTHDQGHAWHGARNIDQRADAQSQIQLNTHSFWRTSHADRKPQ